MNQPSAGGSARAGHRDLLGRPIASSSHATADKDQLDAALERADPWAIAAALIHQQQEGLELASLTARLLDWTCTRQGDATLLISRLLADGMRTAAGIGDLRRAVPMTQVASLAAELQFGAPVVPDSDTPGALVEEAVGAGDPQAARNAIARLNDGGKGGAATERSLIELLYCHAARAGHLAPFLMAACELRDGCGDQAVAPLHAALAARLAVAVGTPPDRTLIAHLERVAPLSEQWGEVHGAQSESRAGAFKEPRFRRHLLDGRAESALKAVHKALAYGIPRELVARSLTLAAAERVLRFEDAITGRADRRESWADVSWLMVQTSAIRQLRHRLDTPGWMGLLAHGVYVVHSAAAMDAAERDRTALPEPETLAQTWDHGPEIGRITGRLQAGEGERAIAALRGYLLLALPEQPLCAQLAELLFEDLAGRADQQAGLIAAGCAAIEEFNALAGHPHRELLLCAAIRQAAAPRPHRLGATAAARLIDDSTGRRAPPAGAPLPWRDR